VIRWCQKNPNKVHLCKKDVMGRDTAPKHVTFGVIVGLKTANTSHLVVRSGHERKHVTVCLFFIYIVTCQPIVGLRNRALLGSRPLNASRPNTCYAAVGEAGSSPRSRDDVTRTRSREISRDLRVSASDVTQPSPGSLLRDGPGNREQCRSYDRGFIRGTEMSKQSVF
jgi:hypothetical protein